MIKKERVTATTRGEEVDKISSGFSLHFPKELALGDAAAKAHLKFFEESDTDILKIMNENLVLYMGEINHGSDYSTVKEMIMGDGFMQGQVELVKKILAGCDRDAFVLGTFHGITASAIHPLEKMDPDYTYGQVREKLCRLLHKDENTILAGTKRIADVMCELAGTYIELGVDGAYYAALDGETRFFTGEEFDKWTKPFDLQVIKAIKDAGGYCFLHICKNQLNMDRYKDHGPYADVVNWGVYEAPSGLEDGRKMFAGKAIMGGPPNRHNTLVDGLAEAVKEEARKVTEDFGRTHFILGVGCILATEQDMDLLKAAVEAAREQCNSQYRKEEQRTMKRRLAMAFAVSMVVGSLTARGGKTDQAGTTAVSKVENAQGGQSGMARGAEAADGERIVYPAGTLTVYAMGNPQYKQQWFETWLKDHKDIASDVKIEFVQTEGTADIREKITIITLSGATKDPLDAAMLDSATIMDLAGAGLLKDETEYLTPLLDKMVDGVATDATIGGRICALPDSVRPQAPFYNQEVFDKYGMDVEQMKTMEGYIEVGRQLREKSNGEVYLFYTDPTSKTWRYWDRRGLMPSAGAKI